MDAPSIVNNLALSVIAGAYILLFTIQLILWNKIEKILSHLDGYSDLCEGRLTVLDRVTSQVTDEEFDSKAVALGKQKHPSTHRLRRAFDGVL